MSESILASWNEGAAKAEVLDFVNRATSEGPDFVAVEDRIATFDNDGTLWVEKPAPPQFDFLLRAWSAAVKADPTLASQQPYKAIVEHDEEFFAGLVTGPRGCGLVGGCCGALVGGHDPGGLRL
jgi:hypothetical protein